jgi:phage tail P2-like protein
MGSATERVGSVPAPLRDLWNPQTCPANLLPWLGWALSMDTWNSAWTEQQKRDAIAASVAVHRIKGTVGALEKALGVLEYAVSVEDQIAGLPYRFRLNVELAGESLDDTSALDEAERIALRVKNVRSYLIGVRSYRRSQLPVTIGAATLMGDTVNIYPYIQTNLNDTTPLAYALALHAYETVTVGGYN